MNQLLEIHKHDGSHLSNIQNQYFKNQTIDVNDLDNKKRIDTDFMRFLEGDEQYELKVKEEY